MDVLWQDLRYGVRSLRSSPILTLAAVLSLALGVGANTTMFTLINTLFLNPLPVSRPAELVAVFTLDASNPTRFGNLLPLSYPNLTDIRAHNDVLTDVAGLLTVFGALALGLACVGLYGILAYAVGQRQRELGLRMALGADRGAVLRLVLREAAMLVGIGVLLGLGLSAAAGRAVASLLFGLSPIDLPAFLGAAGMLTLVALGASYLPARHASRLDPSVALRR